MTLPTDKILLSPRELADAIGVSESSIKRWADDGTVQVLRTAGGHRRIPIEDAVSFIRVSGVRVVKPELLGISELDPVESIHGAETDILFARLKEGKSDEVQRLILSLYVDGWSLAQLIDGPIRGVMSRLGDLWNHHPDAIFLEHTATDILLQSLSRLRSLLQVPTQNAPTAIGAAPTGDPYILPTLSAAMVLSGAGFRATNLGPETPVATLTRAARELTPDLMWVSTSTRTNFDRLRAEIRTLVDTIAGYNGTLVIGGRESRSLNLAPTARLFIGSTMVELEAFVRGLSSQSDRGASEQVSRQA